MAYGFLVRKGNKTIMDSDFPNLMFDSKGTLSLSLHSSSSTAKLVTNHDGSNTGPVYFDEYRGGIARPLEGQVLFFEVPAGRRVYAGYYTDGTVMVYSNASSIRWVKARYMRYLPEPPTGSYGMFVRDAQGRFTYSSTETYLNVTGTLYSATSGIWVAPSTHGFYGSGNTSADSAGLYFDQGVRNNAGTLIPEALRGLVQRDIPASDSRWSKVRGLVADITWSEL